MLPKPNRLRAGSDFNLITKTGARFSSPNLVLYANLAKTDQPKIGFIVNRSVGGSVTRHLVTRKLRHNFASHIQVLPNNLMIVVRVLKSQNVTIAYDTYKDAGLNLLGEISDDPYGNKHFFLKDI